MFAGPRSPLAPAPRRACGQPAAPQGEWFSVVVVVVVAVVVIFIKLNNLLLYIYIVYFLILILERILRIMINNDNMCDEKQKKTESD